MNAKFSQGKVKRLVGGQDEFVDGELVTLSGGFLGKDDFTREATETDKFVTYKDEYAEFRKSLLPPSPPASDGASGSAAAAGADAAGAGDTKPPSAR